MTFDKKQELKIIKLYKKGYSLEKIGKLYSCCAHTILKCLKINNIPRRIKYQVISQIGITRFKQILNKNQIKKIIYLYTIKKKSCQEISKLFDCEKMTILNYLKRNNIKRRSISKAITLNPPSTIFKEGHKNNLGRKRLDITGKNNHWWKGGRYTTKKYIFVHSPEHPLANNKGYVMEHRLAMESMLGRYLNREEIVHHIDFDKQNNQIENLHLFKNNTSHNKYHQFLIKLIKDEIDKGVCKKIDLLK